MLRSKNDNWRTPPEVVKVVRHALGGVIDLDPCGNRHSLVGADKQYLLSKGQDGLRLPWKGRIFINPPFSSSGLWVAKAVQEFALGDGLELIMLLPARVDTRSFHEYIAPSVTGVCFWKGRISFVGAKASAPFPTMFCYWGEDLVQFAEAFRARGHVMSRYETSSY
jgi:site-specific DNA-methyltransferase (adenine-specific)